LLEFFLALDAVARPRDGLQALGVDFFAAVDAFAEAAFADAGQGLINHLQQLALIVALAEEKFLVVGTGGAVGDILRRVFVGGTSVGLVAVHRAAQLLLPRFQTFLECVDLLLIHRSLQT
jgi:hypothetical protein